MPMHAGGVVHDAAIGANFFSRLNLSAAALEDQTKRVARDRAGKLPSPG